MQSTSIPPGLDGVPLLGNARAFRRDPLAFLQTLVHVYGDVARFRLGRRVVIQLSNPEHIYRVLVADADAFVKAGALKRASEVLGNGLVASDGELHRKQRKLLQPAFSRTQLDSYCDAMSQSAISASERWPADVAIDVFEEMQGITLDIVARTLLGSDLQPIQREIEAALTCILEYFNFLLSPMANVTKWLNLRKKWRFKQAVRVLDSVIAKAIANPSNHADAAPASILVSLLTQAATSASTSPRQMRDEMVTLLTAGHETIATALTWSLYLISHHPTVQDQMCREVDETLQGRAACANDVRSLKFTRMVLAEAMRLYPPVWAITRRAVRDVIIDGFLIPKGSLVGMSQFIVHRDARYFAEPTEFRPQRWDGVNMARTLLSGYFPFGAGARVCIGESFAWTEGALVLATLCQRWRFEPCLDAPRVRLQPLITLRPHGGMPLLVRRRPVAAQGAGPEFSPQELAGAK